MDDDATNAETEITMKINDRDKPIKRCFITVGATASFTSLIRNALSTSFLETLHKHNYTHLRIQYGKDGQKVFEDYAWVLPDDLKQRLSIDISGFDFRKDGLKEEMLAAKRGLTVRGDNPIKKTGNNEEDAETKEIKAGVEGCVISHAGKSVDAFPLLLSFGDCAHRIQGQHR